MKLSNETEKAIDMIATIVVGVNASGAWDPPCCDNAADHPPDMRSLTQRDRFVFALRAFAMSLRPEVKP